MRRTQLLRRRCVYLRDARLDDTSLITDRQYYNLLLFLWVAVSHSIIVDDGQVYMLLTKDKELGFDYVILFTP